jgi:hypothetical protein
VGKIKEVEVPKDGYKRSSLVARRETREYEYVGWDRESCVGWDRESCVGDIVEGLVVRILTC